MTRQGSHFLIPVYYTHSLIEIGRRKEVKRIRATLKLHRYPRQRLPIVLVARDARSSLVWTQALEANVAPGLIDVETHYYVMSTSVQSRSLSSSDFLELLARLHDASSNGYETSRRERYAKIVSS